jgi:hypothetical protein
MLPVTDVRPITVVLHAVDPSVQRNGDGSPRTKARRWHAKNKLSERERRPRHPAGAFEETTVATGDVRCHLVDIVQRSDDELLVVAMQGLQPSSTLDAAAALLKRFMRATSRCITGDSLHRRRVPQHRPFE